MKFLEHIFDSKSEPDFTKTDEDNSKREVIEKEIMEWLMLLVNNVDIDADNAINYFKRLQTIGFHKNFVNASVSDLKITSFCNQNVCLYRSQIHARVMKIVQQLSVQKFYDLFSQLNIWHFQVC